MNRKDILDYARKTPTNTNVNVLGSMIDSVVRDSGGSGDSENRIITLKIIRNQFINEDDERLMFEFMIPYFLENEIDVKYNNEKIISIEHESVSGYGHAHTEIYHITTDNNVYDVSIFCSDDGDVFYPTINDEDVHNIGLFSITIYTKKMFLVATNDDGSVIYFSDLYDVCEEPTCPEDIPFTQVYYQLRAFDNDYSENMAVDSKLPPVLQDSWYRIGE